MRPVDKGDSPYQAIGQYSEALPHLEKAIGMYCSYCELMIDHVPEVEHKSAKGAGGDLTDWANLLLGCKYCNTRKKKKATPENADDFLWPDNENTAIAYTYDNGIPRVNRDVLLQLDPSGETLAKAQKTFDLVDLGKGPDRKSKDRRFKCRNKAYEMALNSLELWKKGKDSEVELRGLIKSEILCNAGHCGFFSTWLTVFREEPEILTELINVFPGTNLRCYDEMGYPKCILLKDNESNE